MPSKVLRGPKNRADLRDALIMLTGCASAEHRPPRQAAFSHLRFLPGLAMMERWGDEFGDCSKEGESFRARPLLMQALRGGLPTGGLSLPLQIQSQATLKVGLCPDAVYGLLHLALPTISPLHSVGCRRQEFIVQERQRLLQVGRAQLVQAPPKLAVAYCSLCAHNRASLANAVSVRQRRSNSR